MAAPASCDRTTLTELAAVALRVRGWLDAFDATIATAASRLAEPADSVLAVEGRRSGRDARAVAERGLVCELMPSLHAALSEGTISAGHVDTLARAAGRLDGAARDELVVLAPTLIASATASSVEAFERHVRDLEQVLSRDEGVRRQERLRRQRSLRRWVDRRSGMCHTHVVLDPESDAKVSAALDAAVAAERTTPESVDSRTFEQLRADAFVALATSARSGGRRPPEITVLVDHDTLCNGLHRRSVCETSEGQPLPPETVRRLACDATIIPITVSGDGVVLDHGRTRRVATTEQRRALRAMYRTCGHPGCDVRFADCQIHHVIEWLRQRGPTDLDNLLPLCSTHHHLVHDGGWHVTLHRDRTITLTRPDGTVAFHGSSIDVAPGGVHAAPRPDATPDEGDDDDLMAALARALGAHAA